MNVLDQSLELDPAVKAAMQKACDRIARGIAPTMEERRAAAAIIDQMREENARSFGVQDVTFATVRESRSKS